LVDRQKMSLRGFASIVAVGLGAFALEQFFFGPDVVVRKIAAGKLFQARCDLKKRTPPLPVRNKACRALLDACESGVSDSEVWCMDSVAILLDCGRDDPAFASEYQRVHRVWLNRYERREAQRRQEEEQELIQKNMHQWLSAPEVWFGQMMDAEASGTPLYHGKNRRLTADDIVVLARDSVERILRNTGSKSQLCWLLDNHLRKFPDHHPAESVAAWNKQLKCESRRN
jgi:hypothetical protein